MSHKINNFVRGSKGLEHLGPFSDPDNVTTYKVGLMKYDSKSICATEINFV